MGHIGEAPDYHIDPEFLRRVTEVIGYAHGAGLKAIINLHHDGNWGWGKEQDQELQYEIVNHGIRFL
jgi:aryl-phospho-beta-D-glucosidase BglC (GH1 family)